MLRCFEIYFVVSGEKSVVPVRCSASIWFKVQFRKSNSSLQGLSSWSGTYYSNFKCSFFTLFFAALWFLDPLMPPLKTRGTCSLCPSVNETDTTLLFDIDINL